MGHLGEILKALFGPAILIALAGLPPLLLIVILNILKQRKERKGQ